MPHEYIYIYIYIEVVCDSVYCFVLIMRESEVVMTQNQARDPYVNQGKSKFILRKLSLD
jgi:hypothetical protein